MLQREHCTPAHLLTRCLCARDSINKLSDNFVANTDADNDGVGSKWSLKAVMDYLRKELGVDTDKATDACSATHFSVCIFAPTAACRSCGQSTQ